MVRASTAVLAAAAALALYGCARKDETPTINASMTGVMEPKAEKIWGIASHAYNDIGDALLPEKISDADWKVIGEAGRAIKERAAILATAPHVVVATANEPIMGSQAVGQKGNLGKAWEAVSAQAVQARIEADRPGFQAKARVLVEAADGLVRASQTKDAALFYKIASGMDEVCDGCHEPFWGTDVPPPLPLAGGQRVQ